MLNSLDIKNIALIEQLNIEIKQGMTVLTGETGAGKSIIIDAVNLLLGARTNKALVRYGTEKARVQGLFSCTEQLAEILEEQGIDECEDLVVSREITADGKSVCRINGVMVAQNVLREIGAYLINIHGQQDNQALLNPSKHIDFLDGYAKTELDAFFRLYQERKSILRQIEELTKNEQERIQRIDLLQYQVNELFEAGLKIGEKDELSEQKTIIENAEKIAMSVGEAYTFLYEENGAYDGISMAVSALGRITGIDERLDEIVSKITDMQYVIEDCVHELKSFGDSVEYDEAVLNDIEERLDLITKLERKYGGSEEAAIAYMESASAELARLENADETVSELHEQLCRIEADIKKEAEKLTKHRRLAAKKLQEEIEKSLAELDMPKVKFEVMLTPCEYTPKGADSVEFMICPNVGEPMKPLVQIASGGELSRVMLAVKSIIADSVDTLIFDEIDTGVSGSAAQKIAKKLSALADGKQVICVSHQPQLAAAADNHYMIKKGEDGDRTVTRIYELSMEERVTELARIIDGDNITETAINHAKEMLKL
ncbi:MAG: DNA repair protein RecN [Clostridia bacterium]|nr:DNA repair protein RecN [Clostridia bacterium]